MQRIAMRKSVPGANTASGKELCGGLFKALKQPRPVVADRALYFETQGLDIPLQFP